MGFVSMIDHIENNDEIFDEEIEYEDEDVEISLDDVEFDYDSILDFSLIQETELNSVSISGVVKKIVFNKHEDLDFLTIDILNSFEDFNSYMKISFINEHAIQYKDFFEEDKEYKFYDFTLQIKKNRKNGSLNPRLNCKDESDVVEV